MGSGSSADILRRTENIQKILTSTSPRNIDSPDWAELLKQEFDPRFWTEVYLSSRSSFDAIVQQSITAPLLALNDKTGNFRTLLRFAARLLYYHRTSTPSTPSPAKPEALIALIVLITHVIRGFQDKLNLAELLFHLDQAPLAPQNEERLFLHFWGNTISMEMVPGVPGQTLVDHTLKSFEHELRIPFELRRIDTPGTFPPEVSGAMLDSGITHFVICPKAVANDGSVSFILEEVSEFIVSTSWGAISSAVPDREPNEDGTVNVVRNTRVPLYNMELHGALIDLLTDMFHTPVILEAMLEKNCDALIVTLLNFLWLHSYSHRVLDGSLPGAEHRVDVTANEYEQSNEISTLVAHRSLQLCCLLLWSHRDMRDILKNVSDAKAAGDKYEPKNAGPLHFTPMVTYLMEQLRTPLVPLMMYTLTHHCPAFREHLRANMDPNYVLIPLLKVIWVQTGESMETEVEPSDITLMVLVLFNLLRDPDYQKLLEVQFETRLLELGGIPQLTISIGSILAVTLCRVAKWNFQTTTRNVFFNELIGGFFGNLNIPMHWYAAQEIVDLLTALGKKLSTKAMTQPLALDLCRPIICFIRRCLSRAERGTVGFALVRRGDRLRNATGGGLEMFQPLLHELERMERVLTDDNDYELEEAVALLEAMEPPEYPPITSWIYEEGSDRQYFHKCLYRGAHRLGLILHKKERVA